MIFYARQRYHLLLSLAAVLLYLLPARSQAQEEVAPQDSSQSSSQSSSQVPAEAGSQNQLEQLAQSEVAVEIEPLVVGKEGQRYHRKDLFRRGKDYYQSFTIQEAEVRIQQKNLATSNTTQPQLLPEFSQKAELLRDFYGYGANDFVELYFAMEDLPTTDLLYILNRLLQMNTMTGIRYFSTRKQAMTTYITSCYVVSAAKSRKEIAPPQYEQLPQQPVRLIIRQDDNRFAPTWYDVTIRIGKDGSLRLTMQNITPIYVQFIFYFKALDTGKVRHEIVLLPAAAERGPVIYALSQTHNQRTKVLGIPLDLGNSFNRRMSAIQGWIAQRLYGD